MHHAFQIIDQLLSLGGIQNQSRVRASSLRIPISGQGWGEGYTTIFMTDFDYILVGVYLMYELILQHGRGTRLYEEFPGLQISW